MVEFRSRGLTLSTSSNRWTMPKCKPVGNLASRLAYCNSEKVGACMSL